MYLKSLEIQGFKSFPDKTVLTFDQDITAIVGPNGSGKSNISDAIRWVMGEQSTKSLRGGKMEDVIFGGTQTRKQTGYAEVSLVLDNSQGIFPLEQAEVMITRRYYRSGDSEYYINRRSCRLRDINELFMDTGLGREGYSIIGQGRIDEILSVKSQDRREIFEEAAGISRFRHRKEDAEKHLSKTEENLVRINDKLSELELQVEPLRQQAEKARKYLTLRDELRGLEVSLWMTQLDQLRAGNIKLMTDYAHAVSQRDEAARAQENYYARTEELQQLLHGQEQQADQVRQEQARLESRRAEADSRLAVIKTQGQSNLDTIRRLEIELGDQENRQQTVAQQIRQGQTRLEEIAGERTALLGQLSVARDQQQQLSQQTHQVSIQIDTLRQEQAARLQLSGETRALISALAASSQELLDRDTGLRNTLSQSMQDLSRAREMAEENQRAHAQQKEKRQEAQNRIDAWKLKTQNRQRRADQLTDKLNQLKVEGNTLRSRIHMLTEMEKVFEGYSKAVRQVMTEAGRGGLSHIRGPVAGLIRVPDAYTVAIEIALGGAMQHIVVDTEEAGKRAIQWLKRRDAGRATFLPMDVIRGNALQEQGLEQEFGFVGIASQLIEYDPSYQKVMTNLLGRVVIAEDMDSAIQIANNHHHRFRIVTLDGQVLNPGGSMTGGSVSRTAGILSRSNELKRLNTQYQRLQKDLSQAEQDCIQERRQLEKLSYQLEAAGGELREAEDQLLRLTTQAESDSRTIADLEQRIEATKKEIQLLSDRSGQNEEKIAQARQQIAEAEQQSAALQQQLDDLTARHTQLTGQTGDCTRQIGGLQVQLAGLEAESETITASLTQLQQLQLDLSGDRDSRLRMMERLQTENLQLDREMQALQTTLEQLLSQKAELEQQLSDLNREKLNLEAERSRVERESRDKGNELLLMEREVAALEQKKTAATNEENQLLDRLWDNYQLSHSAAQKVRFQLESLSKTTRRISELKRGISALGNVNVGAIEDFERVNGRYTYLTEQRDDVIRSKEELLTIIGGITKEMETIFQEAFANIQQSFSSTFQELFGGGRASLELENPQDILNCGIEIRVQPPGKALKVITLLSGGEKAFVAIALYFAILKVRPTPFVVMDEIEAALDDSNVVRFAQYMRTITAKTQFIVITHRRGTMEEADTLYGVTMQEQGISRMLTLNMQQVQQELGID